MPALQSVEQAIEKLLASVEPVPECETTAIDKALARVSAQSYQSTINIPPEDNSAMDGFALHTDTLKLTTTLPISVRIVAGQSRITLKQGTAARIFTGAPIPVGANAVVVQEQCEFSDSSGDSNTVKISQIPLPGENIRAEGQDLKIGDCIVKQGTLLEPQHIGLLAAAGIAQITTRRPIRAGVISSGDELVEPGSTIESGQIYNSNAPMLEALIRKAGCEVVCVKHIPDDETATEAAFTELASRCDLIVSSGGVSAGDEDHVKHAIAKLGEIDFHKVALKPGKPLMKGKIGTAHVLGLPGNPTSSFVTFLLFALPLLRALQGAPTKLPQPYFEPIAFAIDKPRKRREYLRVRRSADGLVAHPNQSSGVLSSVVWGEGLALIERDLLLQKNDLVPYYPYPVFFNSLPFK